MTRTHESAALPDATIALLGFSPLDEALVLQSLISHDIRHSTDGIGPCAVVVRTTAATLYLIEVARNRYPNARIIVLDGGVGSASVQLARQSDAVALPQEATINLLADAVRGHAVTSRESAARVEVFLSGTLAALSAREVDVLRMLVADAGNDFIAAELGISSHTVRGHIQNVLSKLDVKSRVAAASVAREARLPPWTGRVS